MVARQGQHLNTVESQGSPATIGGISLKQAPCVGPEQGDGHSGGTRDMLPSPAPEFP